MFDWLAISRISYSNRIKKWFLKGIQMNETHLLIFINGSYITGLIAWLLKDILWVRIWTIISFSVYLVFLISEPLLNISDMVWTYLYIIVNVIWVIILILQRRPRKFEGVAKETRELCFQAISDHQFAKIWSLGKVKYIPEDISLTEVGKLPQSLWLVIEGQINVNLPNGKNIILDRGQFLGEQSFLTDEPASATSKSGQGGTKVLVWDREKLLKFVKKNSQFFEIIRLVLLSDVISKVRIAART